MKGNGIKSAFIIIFALALIISSIPCISASASDELSFPYVITPADCLMKTDKCVVIDDFNRPTVSWTSDGAKALDSFDRSPYHPFEGSRSLAFSGKATKSLSGEIDSCRYVAFTVWSDSGTVVTLSVSSPSFDYSSSGNVPGGYWSTVVFDLTDENYINKNTTPKKNSARFDTLTVEADSGFVYLDLVFAFSDPEVLDSLRFICPDWHADGGVYSENRRFYPGTEGELVGTPSAKAGEGRGIEFFLENHSDARTAFMTSVFSDGTSRRESVFLLDGSEPQSVIFDYSSPDVSSIRISFDCTDGGYVDFISFTPISWVGSEPYSHSKGTIRTCLISRDGRTLTVSGEISDCDGCSAFLYSFSRDETIDVSKRTSLSQAVVRDGEFYFSTEVSSDGTAVHRKYVVYVAAPEGNVTVGNPFYVINPDVLSGTAPDFQQRTPKGLGVLTSEYLEYDIGCTSVDVNVGTIISVGGGISYSRGGAVCVINSDKIAELDKVMDGLYRRGIAVYVRVFAEITGDPTIDSMVFREDGTPDTDIFRAVCGFLSERYGTDGGMTENLSGIIIGKSANAGLSGAGCGSVVYSFAGLYRAVFNTVRALNREIGIYLPVCGSWFEHSASYGTDCIPAYAFIRAFDICLSRGGKIPWSLAIDVWDSESDIVSLISAVRLSTGEHSVLFFGGEETSDDNMHIIMTSKYAEAVFLGISGTEVPVDGVIPLFVPDYDGTLMYSDTVSSERLSYLQEISQKLSGLCEKSAASSTISVIEGDIIKIIPSGIEGRATIYDFSDGNSGFTVTDREAVISSGISLGTENGILAVKFNGVPTWSGVIRKIRPGMDLSVAEYLSVRATVGTLPNDEDGVKALIIIRSGNNRAVFRGALSDSGINELIADIGSLSWRGNITEIGVFIRDDNADNPTLLISSVDALSRTASGREIINRVVITQEKPEYPLYKLLIMCGGAVLCAVLIIVRAALRKRGDN